MTTEGVKSLEAEGGGSHSLASVQCCWGKQLIKLGI